MHRGKCFFRAVALSVRIKSSQSLIVSFVGFLAAFLPMLISLQLAEFTDKVQLLYNQLISL